MCPSSRGSPASPFHPDFGVANTFGFGKFYTITAERPEVVQRTLAIAELVRTIKRSYVMGLEQLGCTGCQCLRERTTDSREILRIDEPGPFHGLYDMHLIPGEIYCCPRGEVERWGYDRFAAAKT